MKTLKYCPDRKGKVTHIETFLHCLGNQCAAYHKGKCLKYKTKVKIEQQGEQK